MDVKLLVSRIRREKSRYIGYWLDKLPIGEILCVHIHLPSAFELDSSTYEYSFTSHHFSKYEYCDVDGLKEQYGPKPEKT